MNTKPEKITEQERREQMVYCFAEDAIKEVFGGDTFNYAVPYVNWRTLDASLCGVARQYLPKFKTTAPIVTYGLTVKGVPDNNLPSLARDSWDFRTNSPELQDAVALYKQRKVDAQGLEYFVLSIGISGEVYSKDLMGDLNIVDAASTIHRAAYRNYCSMVDISSGIYITQGTSHQNSDLLDHSLMLAADSPPGYLRDGKKKPGYEGAAHIAAIYIVPVPVDTAISFNDPDYEFVDWFTTEELMNLAFTQRALKTLDSDVIFAGMVNQKLNERLKNLWHIPMEPWTHELCVHNTFLEAAVEHAVEKLEPLI